MRFNAIMQVNGTYKFSLMNLSSLTVRHPQVEVGKWTDNE